MAGRMKMSRIRYLLDEHVSYHLKKAVKKHDADIVIRRIGEPCFPPLETLDPDILTWCETNQFSLVTNNRKTMPGHLKDHLAAGNHAPGIFILSSNLTMGETSYELALISIASDKDEFTDRLIYLPVSR